MVEAIDALVPHTLAETFAVLTGMPPPFRSPVALVEEALGDLRTRCVVLDQPVGVYEEAMSVVRRAGRAGAVVYDALVAVTAARSGATLATLDERAQAIYSATGVKLQTVG